MTSYFVMQSNCLFSTFAIPETKFRDLAKAVAHIWIIRNLSKLS